MTTNYSYDFYLRTIYSSNRFARKTSNRVGIDNTNLIKADTTAMHKIAEKLRKLEYTSDNGTEVLNHAKLFIDTYNNLLESTDASDAEQMSRLHKQMKSLTKEQKDTLESIGISVSASGKLSLNKTTFGKSTPSKIKSVLGEDSPYISKVSSLARKIKRAAGRLQTPEKNTDIDVATTKNLLWDTSSTANKINVIV